MPEAPDTVVLVVEPYAALQQLLLRVLEGEALAAQVVSLVDAQAWLTTQPARLLILDSDASGATTAGPAQTLLALARQQGTPRLVLTAGSSSAERPAHLPAEAYLEKPFPLAVLRQLIRVLLTLAPLA